MPSVIEVAGIEDGLPGWNNLGNPIRGPSSIALDFDLGIVGSDADMHRHTFHLPRTRLPDDLPT
jgi:hypothetical protein